MFKNLFQGRNRFSFWVIFSFFPVVAHSAEVTSLDFKVDSGVSYLDVNLDQATSFRESQGESGRQFVLELDNASVGRLAARELDTSSFNSPVQLVSPYQVKGKNQVRIVMQMRESVKTAVSKNGNMIRVAVSPKGSSFVLKDRESARPQQEPALDSSRTSDGVKLDQLEKSLATKNFIGSKITLQVRDTDVVDVFRLIGDASGFNIILGPGVQGRISLSLVDVPWDQALDVILNTLKLGAERNNNILRILTLENLTKEKKAQLAAEKAAQATAPRITRVFPVSYANLEELSSLLKVFGRKGTEGSQTGTVEVDKRTNSIIVQDIGENIERMTKLIEILDTQTPQVMIEAKVVEATEQFSRGIGGSLGIGATNAGFGQYAASFQNGNPVDQLIGTVFEDGEAFGSTSTDGASIAFSPTLSFISGIDRLNAILNLSERENIVKVVSSPKTVVLNKEKATILQTTPVAIPITTVVEGTLVNSFDVVDAELSLTVEPTITNDEGVLMSLDINRDIPTSSGEQTLVAKRNLETKVLVESGSTLVIGGVYTSDKTDISSGFPFLKDIPIIGVLFGSESTQTLRTELFIFVTPRILNTAAAGLEI